MDEVVTYLKSEKNDYLKSVQNQSRNKFADKKTLFLFRKAAKLVPAYKDFLAKNKINPEKIKNISGFKKYVPFITKENYILRYGLKERCWEGDLTKTHTFAASSGSTGEPVFWPRDIKQEIEGAKIHELLLSKVFDVYNRNTLFINSFGLGNWIAGMYTEMSLYLARLHKVPFTLASPGYNQEENFKVIKSFSKYYDQTIIACHPPILKIMIENGKGEGIKWPDLNVRFLGAGEGFSENWRDYLLSLVGQTDFLRTIINIYGSAEAGLMGFETPLSIALHREASTNHELNKALFNSDRTPFLYQFDPLIKYLEGSIRGEIVITMNATSPLIRYNIHDHGGTIGNFDLLETVEKSSKNFLKRLKKVKINIDDFRFPFVFILGREQFMTSLYGVNIYPENIKAVLEHKLLQPHLTGRFITSKEIDERKDQYLLLRAELKPKVVKKREVENLTQKLFVEILRKLNSEYNQVEQKYKGKMHPKEVLCKFQDSKYFPEGKIQKMA